MQPRLHTLLAAARAAALLLLAGFAISACSSETTAPGQTSTLSIYPLAVGNSWTYRFTLYSDADRDTILFRDTIVWSVDRDTIIGSERWFMLYEHRDSMPTLVRIMRIDSGSVHGWSRSSNSRFLVYKYPSTPGERYPSRPGSTSIITVHDTAATVRIPAGNYYCYKYELIPDFHDYLAPGIGAVKFESHPAGGGSYKPSVLELISARIQ